MAEEQQTPQMPEETSKQPSGRGQKRRQRSVMQYITILFAAAFVLLLFTYMMERRQFEQQQQQDQANISNLQQQSVSAVQTLQGMTEENTQLKEQVTNLQQQIETLEGQLAGAKEEQSSTEARLQEEEERTKALIWFWELNDAYVRGRLNTCRELIDSMEEAGLVEFLPSENITGTDHLSPTERYQVIYDRVVK